MPGREFFVNSEPFFMSDTDATRLIFQPIVMMPGLILLGIVIVWLNFLFYKKRLEPLVPLLSGIIRNNWGRAVLQGVWDGKTVEIVLIPAGKNTPPKMQIALKNYYAFNLKISQDSFVYQWSKKLGLMKEVEIGEPEFDKKYFLETNNPQEVISFLTSKKQDIVKSLNFSQLVFTPQEVRYILAHYRDEHLQAQQVVDVLQKLSALAG